MTGTCACGKFARVKGLCFACYNKSRRQKDPEKYKKQQKRDYSSYREKHQLEWALRAFFKKSGSRPFIEDYDPNYIPKTKRRRESRRIFTCSKCKRTKEHGASFIDGKVYCKACTHQIEDRKRADEIFRLSQAQEAIDKIDPLGDMKKTCTKLGTCDILYFHHELLKDDPERLESDFLIGLICGEEGAQRYKEKKAAETLGEWMANNG